MIIVLSLRGFQIIPVRVFHYRLPVYGFRIGNFAYITDANYIPEESKEKLFGVKYLVINALEKGKTYFSLQFTGSYGFYQGNFT